MKTFHSTDEIPWRNYPDILKQEHARRWVELQALLGRARNTIDSYASLDSHGGD
jgi:hypothetical protein